LSAVSRLSGCAGSPVAGRCCPQWCPLIYGSTGINCQCKARQILNVDYQQKRFLFTALAAIMWLNQ
jgi:hypothetical protein